jgi:hypothetical protein
MGKLACQSILELDLWACTRDPSRSHIFICNCHDHTNQQFRQPSTSSIHLPHPNQLKRPVRDHISAPWAPRPTRKARLSPHTRHHHPPQALLEQPSMLLIPLLNYIVKRLSANTMTDLHLERAVMVGLPSTREDVGAALLLNAIPVTCLTDHLICCESRTRLLIERPI